MHISQRMFQSIIKIVKYQAFSKLTVLHPLFIWKPFRDRLKTKFFQLDIFVSLQMYILFDEYLKL